MADSCISLAGSTSCPAFNSSSISTSPTLTGLFPFLSYVSDTASFDDRIRQYIATDYSREKYQQLIGCSAVNLTNTTDIYARYTTSVLCNAIVQNSISACGASANDTKPLCADSCAEFAISEQEITASPELCGNSGQNALSQIRADFTNCALPANSLSGSCVTGAQNEPNDCGFQSNLQGLCSFCAASSPNATDSCCVNSGVEQRCVGVHLPTTTSMAPLFPSSTFSAVPSATSTHAAAAAGTAHGLTGGQIAGIVIGSILGAALILAAIIFFCFYLRKKQRSPPTSIFNHPSPVRQPAPAAPAMSFTDGTQPPTILPGARVARMSALEGSTTSSARHSPPGAAGALGGYRRTSDGYSGSPDSQRSRLAVGTLPKREGSLSSNSALGSVGRNSPHSGSGNGDQFSSPEGVASGQSEQLQFFKDYYSQDEIRPNDTVATLWAYQPRANDEFELERGDMLKVVGIWDDGWATGVKLSESAEQWEARRNVQRDSGVSNGSRRSGVTSDSEIKAFPLVCVCLPQHWRKTIEGDSTDTTGGGGGGSGGPHGSP
ncbi:SH3 domain-containing protein [Glonium stellatum]|uniref:SH3 domain-containing protein n=1 Tax=Glonium stellatum TaxID=574774 RepID=A0A8E2JRQ9_9PEZI|nr:SH3 domain-containing protein [Glonium stellatum]